MPYPIPPWLSSAPSPAQEYSRGVSLGVNIAQQQQHLRAQQEQAAMTAAVRQQEMERESIRQQQELMMKKAYEDARIGLQQRELDQVQEMNALKTKQAAQKFAAQQTASRRIAAGEDVGKVMLELGPQMGESMTGAASLYRATRPTPAFTPRETTTPGGVKMIETAPNRWAQAKLPTGTQQLVEGGIQSVPIYYPGTKTPIKGMAGVPTEGGGYTTRNIPDRETRIALNRLQAIEKIIGPETLMLDEEPKAERMKKLYRKFKPEYDRLKKIVEEGGEPESAPAAAPAGSSSRVRVKDPEGKVGTIPVDQLDDALAAGWKKL